MAERADERWTALRRRMHNDRVRAEADGVPTKRYAEWIAPATRAEVDALLAELETRDVAISEVVNELRFRASQTNAAGQVEPPYTAVSLQSMADVLSASGGGSDG